jgi:hypothetical protein
MSDKQLAAIARNLAKALNKFAHERDDPGRKIIAQIQTELCAVYRQELLDEELARADTPPPEPPHDQSPPAQ